MMEAAPTIRMTKAARSSSTKKSLASLPTLSRASWLMTRASASVEPSARQQQQQQAALAAAAAPEGPATKRSPERSRAVYPWRQGREQRKKKPMAVPAELQSYTRA